MNLQVLYKNKPVYYLIDIDNNYSKPYYSFSDACKSLTNRWCYIYRPFDKAWWLDKDGYLERVD